MERLNKTGLVVPDYVPWGTHLCQFYETKDDLLEVLVPYFKAGLEANEACIWVTSDLLSTEEALAALKSEVPDLDHRLKSGQMEITTDDAWYQRNGSFDIDAVLKGWCRKAENALRDGYSGLRVTGSSLTLLDESWEDWLAYEQKVQQGLANQKLIALCPYPLQKCSASQFLQAVDSHDCALVQRQGKWECAESQNSRQLLDRLRIKRHALNSSISPLVMTDLEGRLTYANPVAVETWGCEDESEVLGRRAVDFWQHPDQFEAYLEEIRLKGSCTDELIAKRKCGSTFVVEIHGSLIKNDEEQPIGMVGSCIDLTDRRAAEARLRESEEWLQSIVQNSTAIIYTLSPDGIFTYVSPAWSRHLGHELCEVVGNSFVPFVHPSDVSTCQDYLHEILDTGRPQQSVEYRVLHKDGTWRWHQSSGSCIKDQQGSPVSFVGICEDITDRKTAEKSLEEYAISLQRANSLLEEASAKAEAANRSKSEFLANMSHEIRTPMTAILGYADLLAESAANPEQTEAAHTIHRNGEHLLGIISDILDLSKIEAGKLELEKTPCSPESILREVVSLMKVKADGKGLPLQVESRGAVPSKVMSDPVRVRQILVNLVGNAIKFTETGQVKVAMRCEDESKGPPRLTFDVSDTGIGISPGRASELFRPFVQAESSTTREYGGSGLGLAISKRLANMLGGDIVVKSRIGEGSVFSLSIPVQLPVKVEQGACQLTSSQSKSDLPKLDCRVLLVEDGPDNQRLIAFLLKKAGVEVVLADNGQIAVEKALSPEGKFDVILMDMQMPIMDGYEATRALREANYDGPIIALTAHAMKHDLQKCLDAGCDDYQAKPVDRGTLLRIVEKYASATSVGAGSE